MSEAHGLSNNLQHECPMCGESMRLMPHTRLRLIPGLPERRVIEVVEWECPECDYFEEIDVKPDVGPGTPGKSQP